MLQMKRLIVILNNLHVSWHDCHAVALWLLIDLLFDV